MDIKLKNTLTNKKEVFKPLKEGHISMYNCGPTVYNYPSIGNLRSYIFADTIRRTFEYFGFSVKQVINITDVGHLVGDGDVGDDKVEKAAKENNKSAKDITKFYENYFFQNLKELNINTEGTNFPKASEHIDEQIELIKILEEKGAVYKLNDGMYFDTSTFPDYGKLGNINIDGLKEGARVEQNTEKRNITDFALWKFSSPTENRLQEWDSPWGVGFPGWHIECSAMSRKYLGQPFDIHTGGIDHIPVHHNNEIAQSEKAYDAPLANYWLHNEFLKVNNEKMSKSLNNIFTLDDIKEHKIHPLSFKYFILGAKYDSPLNFTWESLEASQIALEKVVTEYINLPSVSSESDQNDFIEAITDDLNTPVLLSYLQNAKSKNEIDELDKILGLNINKLSKEIQNIPDDIQDLFNERNMARKNEDWKKSDEIRDKIEFNGYKIYDSSEKSLIFKTISGISTLPIDK